MKHKILIFENDCFETLFSTDIEILNKICSEIVVPIFSFEDFQYTTNKKIIDAIDECISSKLLTVGDFYHDTEEYQLYKKLTKGKNCVCRGKCESMAISLAKFKNLTILSNNNLNFCKEFHIQRLSMVDLITNAYLNNLITIEEAELIWSKLIVKSNNYTTFTQFISTKMET